MSDKAMMGSTKPLKQYADGAVVVAIYFPADQAMEAMQAFGIPDTPVAVAKISQQSANEQLQKQTIEAEKENYGKYAKALRLNNFCVAPAVKAALGFSADKNIDQQIVWDELKKELGFDSMRDVPPKTLLLWAQLNNVAHLLPRAYKEA